MCIVDAIFSRSQHCGRPVNPYYTLLRIKNKISLYCTVVESEGMFLYNFIQCVMEETPAIFPHTYKIYTASPAAERNKRKG